MTEIIQHRGRAERISALQERPLRLQPEQVRADVLVVRAPRLKLLASYASGGQTVHGKEIDLRISTVPTMHGESVVMRILDKGGVALDFKRLGFEDDTL